MKSKDIEIEIQVKLDGVAKLIKHLKKNAIFVSSNWQKDVYFSPIDRSKSYINKYPVDEWLRVRYEKNKMSITYKNFHRDSSNFSKYCDEYNSDVSDGRSLEKIFEAMGFEKIITVEKNRTSYMDGEYEVSIDKIKGLGDFVEVEYKGKNTKKSTFKIKEEMANYLKNIGCTKIMINNGGYPFMILFPEKVETKEL
ncbi:MAG: class IV adenylate cyclase [Patescibacteria group bacterium]